MKILPTLKKISKCVKKFQSVLNLRLSLCTTKTNFTHKVRYEGTSTFSIIETLNPPRKNMHKSEILDTSESNLPSLRMGVGVWIK